MTTPTDQNGAPGPLADIAAPGCGTPADLTAARQRIAAAYDPLLLQDSGHRLADLLTAHLARAEEGESAAVLPWVEPADGIRVAASYPARPGGRTFVLPRRTGRALLQPSPGDAAARPQSPRSPVHRPPGAGPGAARRPVRRGRVGHQPGDGHLRDGPLRHGRGTRDDRGAGRGSGWEPGSSPAPSPTAARWPTSPGC